MKKVKRIALVVLGTTSLATAQAQDDSFETTIETDVVSNYIWRGQKLGEVSLQPTLGVSWNGLSLTAWGSVGLSDQNDAKEFDLTLGYETGGFRAAVTDYFISDHTDQTPYFCYRSGRTAHVFEGTVGYDFGWLSLQWNTVFAGADGKTKSGKRAYSSYAEVSVPFRLGGCQWKATVGAVPYATDYYADAKGFAVTHVGLRAEKELTLSQSFRLPLFAGIYANPSTEKAYYVIGFTIR